MSDSTMNQTEKLHRIVRKDLANKIKQKHFICKIYCKIYEIFGIGDALKILDYLYYLYLTVS